MIRNIILKNRSYRRFHEDFIIDEKTLRELVGLARLSPSASNLQPLKFVLSFTPKTNDLIFPSLRWAGYLKNWPGPAKGERPTAYIIILGDTSIAKSFGCDHGIAGQSIMMGAVEKGLGGCMLGSIDREGIQKRLKIPNQYEILLVIALGKPKEKVVIENLNKDNMKYWRDKDNIHHVPKRSLDDIILSFE